MQLRELKEKDADRMLSWMHSEKSRDIFAKDFNNFTKDDVISFINKKNTSENINYACVDDNDNYLGTISLKNIDYENEKHLVTDKLIDSIDMSSVLAELEDTFDIEIDMEYIVPENFDSVEAMWDMVQELLGE